MTDSSDVPQSDGDRSLVRAVARRLSELRFAVVDVETTGGASRRGHRVIDIGIVEVAGGQVTAEYESLVNPGRAVPPAITALTGITTDMVR
ncbi:MAG: exonuclease domain-containing protein, partial [Gemmatimonadota bacterium]